MRTFLVGASLIAGAVLAADARPVAGQVSAGMQVSWHWSDDGWRSGPVVDGYVHWSDRPYYAPAAYDRVPVRVRPAPRARFRVPPGHMPPPGMCRVWIVGRPAGHQPRPTSCAKAFRTGYGPGVVILHTPSRADRWRFSDDRWGERWDDRGWDDDRWDDDRRGDDRRGDDRGRGRGGRGGR